MTATTNPQESGTPQGTGQGTPATSQSVVIANPSTLVTGQCKIATTGTAVQIVATSTPLVNGVVITSLSTNTGLATVGPSGITNVTTGAGNGYILSPGQSISFGVTDASFVYVNGTSGQIFSWSGN